MDYTDWKVHGKLCGAEQRGDASAQRTGKMLDCLTLNKCGV